MIKKNELNRNGIAFLERQTGFDQLARRMRGYDANIAIHYASSGTFAGFNADDVNKMGHIAREITKGNADDYVGINDSVLVAYGRAKSGSDKGILAAYQRFAARMPSENSPEVAALSKTRNDAVKRATVILDTLDNAGVEYEIKSDGKGEIVAEWLNDTKMAIRLMDAKRPDMVGRVYQNGATSYFQFAETNLANSNETPLLPPEFAALPLNYKLGRSLPRYLSNNGSYTEAASFPKIGVQAAVEGRKYADSYITNDTHSAMVITAANKINFTAKTGKNLEVYPDVRLITKQERMPRGGNFSDEYDDGGLVKTKIDVATDYVLAASDSAKSNFIKEMGIGTFDSESGLYCITDDLESEENKLNIAAKIAAGYDHANENGDPLTSAFVYSEIKQVADLQKEYINSRAAIYVKEFDEPSFLGKLEEHDALFTEKIDNMFGSSDPTPRIRDEEFLGNFNGPNIAAHMTSAQSFMTNEAILQKAFKLTDRKYRLEKGGYDQSRFNEDTVKFDAQNAENLPYKNQDGYENLSDFRKKIADAAHESLEESGVSGVNLRIDTNGIIEYQGTICRGEKGDVWEEIRGSIGQVFEPINAPLKPDGTPNPAHGLVPTAFSGGDNKNLTT